MFSLASPALGDPGDVWFLREDAAVYSETSSLSRPLGDLATGQEVIELERWASWLRVRFGPGESGTGWIPVQKLVSVPPAHRDEPASRSSAEAGMVQDEEEFLLEVTADHQMLVRIRCDLVNPDLRRVERTIQKETPVNVRFTETIAVSCSIRDREHLESPGLAAVLSSQGVVLARARTDAIHTRSIRLRSRGPWGDARSEVCRVRIVGSSIGAARNLLVEDCRPLR